ncbi:MAG: hypothetical protein ABL908_07980 [Hyphomicrobium sp.]
MLTVAEIMDEGFERVGVDPASVEHRHLISARRSLNLLFTELYAGSFADEDYLDLVRVSVNVNQRMIVLDADTLDVIDAVALPTSNNPIPLERMSRQDDLMLRFRQDAAGTPSQFWVAKTGLTDLDLQEMPSGGWGQGSVGYGTFGGTPSSSGSLPLTNKPLMILWPAPSQDMDIAFNRLRIPTQVTADLSRSVDARAIWCEAICAGLAWKLSVKYAPERTQTLKLEWLEQKNTARIETRERASVVIGYAGFGRSRRGRL